MIGRHGVERLLRAIVGEPEPEEAIGKIVRDGYANAPGVIAGLRFEPELDLQDLGTLIRLWSGEAIEESSPAPVVDRAIEVILGLLENRPGADVTAEHYLRGIGVTVTTDHRDDEEPF